MNDEKMPERLSRTTIYESEHVCLYTDRVKMPSGYIIEKYHQIHYPKEAVVVVIFNENDDILFVHNRRYTVGHLEWEIPAGKIEHGESIEIAAIREAKEETGCDLIDIKFLCSQNPANGMSDALVHCFAAKVQNENAIIDTDEISSKKCKNFNDKSTDNHPDFQDFPIQYRHQVLPNASFQKNLLIHWLSV